MLVDAPFRTSLQDTFLEQPEYRSFWGRPNLADPSEQGTENRDSIQEAFMQHLKRRLTCSPSLLEAATTDPFFILGDLYRIAASNWNLANEYLNRELSTVETILEKEEPSFQDLEIYLKEHYKHRRRYDKYHELITEAKDQCGRRGQNCWQRDSVSNFATEQSQDLEDDFVYLQSRAQGTTHRIEKNINLLTALVAIGEGKQQLKENHGIVRLSLLATVFLPFSTVAAILGMQGNYAPGSGGFWLFWTVTILLTAFVVALSILYDGHGKWTCLWIKGAWGPWLRGIRKSEKK
jgi:hypothetical protein